MAYVTKDERGPDGLVKHTGGCHCGAVRFEVWSAPHLHVFNCNCSICTKKQNRHFIVPKSQFTLLQGSDNIAHTHLTHTWPSTHSAKPVAFRVSTHHGPTLMDLVWHLIVWTLEQSRVSL